jgi:RNA polymerase sigma-70 factor (ECF subfamily)
MSEAGTKRAAIPETVIQAAIDGDAKAMNTLIDRLSPYVASICGPIALERGPDAMQEAFIAIFRGLRLVRESNALFGWVRIVATREAIRVAREGNPLIATPDMMDLPARHDPQLAVDLADTLARLSPEHRAMIVLRDLEGLSEEESAGILAIRAGTAKSRLHRARAAFRKAWQS